MTINALNGVQSDTNPRRITKADKDFMKKLDLKGITFLVTIRDIH